jgi:transcriptional regulator of acetoin/glycerol metabolism
MQRVHASHSDLVCSVVDGGVVSPHRTVIQDQRIADSWGRCINKYGLTPTLHPDHYILEQAKIKASRERAAELVEVATPEMKHLFQQIAGSGFCVVLSNEEGVIVESLFDPAIAQQFMHAGLRLGANWSESYEGTNGVGTAIKEAQPVTVHLQDHFNLSNIGLTCSGSPIFNPMGNVLGVLDVSSTICADSRASQQHTLALVKMTAQQITNRIFLNRYKDHFLIRFHSRAEMVGIMCEGLLALDDQGRVIAANDSALGVLGYDDRPAVIGKMTTDLFSVSVNKLIEHSNKYPYAPMSIHDRRDKRLYHATIQIPKKPLAGSSRRPAAAANVVTIQPRKLSGSLSLDQLANTDPTMCRIAKQAKRVMDRHIPIILYGETGTGKEAVAQAIHNESARRNQNFVAINCAAIPENLIESELFGYKGGAFTGARKEGMRGKVLQANGGTLFLDEIGDMPLGLQSRLLRVLEEREVLALGSETPIPVDFDLIVATHRSLTEMVECGEFREDLYYRINGLTTFLPSLRERTDLQQLIEILLALENDGDEKLSFSVKAMEILTAHDWPGNIRELRNVIRVAVALREGTTIDHHALPAPLLGERPPSSRRPTPQPGSTGASANAPDSALDAAEQEALLEELEKCRWNMTATAKSLNMSRATLYRKMKKHGIVTKN